MTYIQLNARNVFMTASFGEQIILQYMKNYIEDIIDGCNEIWILCSSGKNDISRVRKQRTNEISFLTRIHILT